MRNLSRQQLRHQTLVADRAHFFRHHLTENERILWRRVSSKQLGVAFRRQMPIGKYIADFVAPSAMLIVEVDDRSHELRRAADACCGLRRNWCGAMLRNPSLLLWLRFAQFDYRPVQ